MKVVLHFRAGPLLQSRLRNLTQHGLEIVIVHETDRAGFNREIADAEVLLLKHSIEVWKSFSKIVQRLIRGDVNVIPYQEL